MAHEVGQRCRFGQVDDRSLDLVGQPARRSHDAGQVGERFEHPGRGTRSRCCGEDAFVGEPVDESAQWRGDVGVVGRDRVVAVFRGDVAVERQVPRASERPGSLASALHADGSHHPILCVPGTVASGQVIGDPFLRMDGQAVFKFAVKVLGDVANEVLDAAGVQASSVDWLIPHQANIRIIQATAKRLGVPMERVVTTLDHHGNTSAASIPLALDEAVRAGRLLPGHRIVVEGVGGGFTWGAALIDF